VADADLLEKNTINNTNLYKRKVILVD